MKRKKRIRPLALCVFQHQGSILVSESYDSVKNQHFYRPLGGGIEFGERGPDAVIREIREELSAEVTNLRYLGMLENIFTFESQRGHEIVLIYDGEFVEQSLYAQAAITGHEEPDGLIRAVWKRVADLADSGDPLYPDGLLDLLGSASAAHG